MVLNIINTIVVSGLTLTFYHLLLKQEKTFVFNRFYLLLSLILCLMAPLLTIETQTAMTFSDFSNTLSIERSVAILDDYETTIVEEMNSSSFNFWRLLINVYAFGVLLLLFRFFRNLYTIIRLSKNVKRCIGKLKIVELQDASGSFSFFNHIFIESTSLESSERTNLILKHERAHSMQKHSIDIIVIELIKCFFWFNPFVWLYKHAIVENHEFLADETVVNGGIHISNYAMSIINSKKTLTTNAMSSGFNTVQTKNRLKMLHQSKSTVMRQLIKTITTSALFTCVFMISVSAAYKDPILVVVDAGHGGKDSGHHNEKEINLNIARLLETKSNDRITIKSLRQEDEFISLDDRAKFVNDIKPDLFLSIHCNASSDVTNSGVEAFYYDKGEYSNTSYTFSKLLVSEQLENIAEKGSVKTADFKLLKQIDCPAVLLELGFLSNSKDQSRLTGAKGQLEAANAIYEALEKIQN